MNDTTSAPTPTATTTNAAPPTPAPQTELSHEQRIEWVRLLIHDFIADIQKNPAGGVRLAPEENGFKALLPLYIETKIANIEKYMNSKYWEHILYAVQPELRGDFERLVLTISDEIRKAHQTVSTALYNLAKQGLQDNILLVYLPIP